MRANNSPKPTSVTDIVVSRIAPTGVTNLKSFMRTKKARYLLGLLLMVGVIVTAAIVWQNSRNNMNIIPSDDPPYTMTDEEFAKVRAASLRKTKPAANTSKEDLNAYYNELAINEFTAGNYKAVAGVYTEAVAALQESNLEYSTYIVAAKSYAMLNDTNRAEAILFVAEQKIKSATTFDEFKRTELLDSINSVRKEFRK